MKQYPKGFVHLLVLIIAIIGIGVVGFLVFQNSQLKKQIAQNQSGTPTPTSNSSREADLTSAWQKYTIKTLGIDFKIPPKLASYGVLEEKVSPAEKGTYLCMTFPQKTTRLLPPVFAGGFGCNINTFGLSANSTGFEAGRSGMFTDIQGFVLENGKYYYRWSVGTSYENKNEIPKDIVVVVNNNILKILGKLQEGMLPFPGEGQIGAIINTENKTYPGLIVLAMLSSNFTEKDFDQILSTFKLVN